MIYKKIKHVIHQMVHPENSPEKIALSVSFGVFIALSPFFGFHTIMLFAFSWLLNLNLAVTFAITHLINNPWTMVPIYLTDHWVGHWLLSHWGATTLISANPLWVHLINGKLQSYLGFSGFSLWAFLIGGNLLAFLTSVMLYPIVKQMLIRLVSKRQMETNR